MSCCNSSHSSSQPKPSAKEFTLLDLAKESIRGNVEVVVEDKLNKRLEICKSCPHLVKLPFGVNGTGNCSKCGCFVDLKAKFEKSSCPLHKW